MPDNPEARPRPSDALITVLENQGFRELAAARLFSAGVLLAPSLDEKQMFGRHSLEELTHFEVVASAYAGLTSKELHEAVAQRADAVPMPSVWTELVVAGFLLDRAVIQQLKAYQTSTDGWLAGLANMIVAHENDHLSALEDTLRELCRAHESDAKAVKAHVERWLPIALETFDRPADMASGDAQPPISSAGVAESMRAYVDGIKPVFEACNMVMNLGSILARYL